MNIARAISRIVTFSFHARFSRMDFRIAASAVLVTMFSALHPAGATIVRMETNLGNIDVELYDAQAPKTVANFLRYAGRGDYNTTIIHRSMPGFIIQGGGYKLSGLPNHLTEDPPVPNEFSPSRSNVRGTIAMAKLGGDPNSATSEWFFNLADNSTNLDDQNGGFTVFGRVITGINFVDDIANLQVLDWSRGGQAFGNLPVINYDQIQLTPDNLVLVTRIPNVKSVSTQQGAAWAIFTTDSDMVLDSATTENSATTLSRIRIFESPPNTTVLFGQDMFTFTMTGVMGSAAHAVTLHDGATARPANTRYYAYGKTLDNPTPHWYDFAYDGVTGAEISNNKIILHFVDGQRGDDDLDSTNGSITHTGMPAVVTANAPTQTTTSAGCSIMANPSQTSRGGDWIVVSMFLAFLALARRRAPHALTK